MARKFLASWGWAVYNIDTFFDNLKSPCLPLWGRWPGECRDGEGGKSLSVTALRRCQLSQRESQAEKQRQEVRYGQRI